ncbi:MAG: tyrosine-type recombinase/integrase [Anaerolineae bacterium]|nr:tyrosine-type recombinase/integrase [Anaerolineae bacterium]
MKTIGLRSAVLAFLDSLSVRYARRPRTVQTYRTALGRFLEYLSALGVDPDQEAVSDLDPILVRDFVTFLEGRYREAGRMLPASTRQTYLAALVGWVNFLLDEGLWELPAEEARRLLRDLRAQRGRPSPPLPRLPREEALSALLQAARSRPSSRSLRKELIRLRDMALLLVLRSSGIRVGELVALRRGDFDPVQGLLWVRHGKGGKERLAFLDAAAVQALQAYLQARDGSARGKAVDHRPLFARHDKGAGDQTRPMTPEGVRRALWALAREAGLAETLTPHQFRHYFATRVLEATGDLAAVQDLLGHASPTTTRRYARVSPKRLQAVHRQAFERPESPAEDREEQ